MQSTGVSIRGVRPINAKQSVLPLSVCNQLQLGETSVSYRTLLRDTFFGQNAQKSTLASCRKARFQNFHSVPSDVVRAYLKTVGLQDTRAGPLAARENPLGRASSRRSCESYC
jgi:hypothetical protein